MAKTLIKYLGRSIHKDSEGELWGSNETDTIKATRQYNGTIEKVKESRPDLGFMIEYGQMEAYEVKEDKTTDKAEDKPADKVEEKVADKAPEKAADNKVVVAAK